MVSKVLAPAFTNILILCQEIAGNELIMELVGQCKTIQPTMEALIEQKLTADPDGIGPQWNN